MDDTKLKRESVTISEIHSNIENGISSPIIFQVKVSPIELNHQDPWYLACKKCNKKIMDIEGKLICKECINADHVYKYMLRMKVGDETGQLWVSLFDKRVERLFGCSVEQLRAMKETDIGEFINYMEKCIGKNYSFIIKVSETNNYRRKGYQYTCIALEDLLETKKATEESLDECNEDKLSQPVSNFKSFNADTNNKKRKRTATKRYNEDS